MGRVQQATQDLLVNLDRADNQDFLVNLVHQDLLAFKEFQEKMVILVPRDL